MFLPEFIDNKIFRKYSCATAMARRQITPLKLALVTRHQRQFMIAKRARIGESLFNKIVNGHRQATAEQKSAIARAMRSSVHELFPEPETVEVVS